MILKMNKINKLLEKWKLQVDSTVSVVSTEPDIKRKAKYLFKLLFKTPVSAPLVHIAHPCYFVWAEFLQCTKLNFCCDGLSVYLSWIQMYDVSTGYLLLIVSPAIFSIELVVLWYWTYDSRPLRWHSMAGNMTTSSLKLTKEGYAKNMGSRRCVIII